MKKNLDNKRPPILIALAVSLSVFIGIFTAIAGIIDIQNYNHPYMFGLIFGFIGLILGINISKGLRNILL